MRGCGAWPFAIGLAGCARPDVVGQQVGQSLYDASVNTGRVLSNAGDRAGYALQNAGTNLRKAVNPPPADPGPFVLPPPYVPNDLDARQPVTSTPPAPAY